MKKVYRLAIIMFLFAAMFYSCERKVQDKQVEMNVIGDSLPRVFGENRLDLVTIRLRSEAIVKSAIQQLPTDRQEWESYRDTLRKNIIRRAGIREYHDLPLDMRVTKTIKMNGYTVNNVYFQTLPGIYATANLFVPVGKGPFPAVVNMHGHGPAGKLDERVQACGHTLALNGYVSLIIDAFGSGERSTVHGEPEYHGANLGASLMNIGETLLGMQVSDNMRAVDLLVSLPYVDPQNIGATGASGGGNQTMWFAALDERVKAAMPVVSVGTFESAVMRSNCVCELLPDGLVFTETSGILALFAPRALKMCNHRQDSNPTFFPAEMLKSYTNAKPIFRLFGAEKKISYELFDLVHGYWPEDRAAMLGWFDLHLKGKGDGSSKKEIPFETLPPEELMVFKAGERDSLVITTEEYCRRKGKELRTRYLAKRTFDKGRAKAELRNILKVGDGTATKKVHELHNEEGWDRIALETTDGKLIPLLHYASRGKKGQYTILVNIEGKNAISPDLYKGLIREGKGVIIVDLSGTGEASSENARVPSRLPRFHTLARAELWLGKTLLGEWVKELSLVSDFIDEMYHASEINFDGSGEAGLAGLFLNALENGRFKSLILREAPISYLFDNRELVDSFTMGIHLPGIMEWGDISLAAALNDGDLQFIDPLTMSGRGVEEEYLKKYKEEFQKIKKLINQRGKIHFDNENG